MSKLMILQVFQIISVGDSDAVLTMNDKRRIMMNPWWLFGCHETFYKVIDVRDFW